jgi:hypothetical protein
MREASERFFRMKTQPPTSFAVARRAGVSQSTVSPVLNGKAAGRISQRVQAAHELGYQPCLPARLLNYSVVQVSTGNDARWQEHIVHVLATRCSIDGPILFAVDLPAYSNLELLAGRAVLVDGSAPAFPSFLLDIDSGAPAALLLSGRQTALPPTREIIPLRFVIRESAAPPREKLL